VDKPFLVVHSYNPKEASMKLIRSNLALALKFSLCSLLFIGFAAEIATAQDSRVALQRGYRTGYSDGYMAGYRDAIDNVAKNISKHSDYEDARRAYNPDYGPLEDYRDGYRQGFESGYDAGFGKRAFEATIPTDLAKRSTAQRTTVTGTTNMAAEVKAQPEVVAVLPQKPEPEVVEAVIAPEPEVVITQPVTVPERITATARTEPADRVGDPAPTVRQTPVRTASYTRDDEPIIIIPRDTELIIEIQEDLNTETNRSGDRFTARIVSPSEIDGAIIEGRIERVQKPGRFKRRSELQLSFDRIVINDSRWANFAAMLTEVMPVRGDNVSRVDEEGAAVGKSSYKEDGIRIGAATGAGLGIGAVTAGPVGAAIGAGVGAAFGVGASVVERGKHIRLNQNQQLRIRTSFEVRIR
jgi:hypothetical protein